MRLVHWSGKIVTQVHGRHQDRDYNESRQNRRRYAGPGKPHGFWLSDEQRGAGGWASWCRSERFRPYSLRYEHEVELYENAKILYLRTPKDIDDFGDKYGYSLLEKLGHKLDDSMYGGKYIDQIDWHRVAKKYQGIIITPYIWPQRLGRHMWYYGWDCASGCIWNARAIKSIKMVKERKVPRRPTRAQENRKHKRQRENMIKATEALKKLNQESGAYEKAGIKTEA